MLENDEELDDERYWLDLEVCGVILSASMSRITEATE
jgi:hypothetical protein